MFARAGGGLQELSPVRPCPARRTVVNEHNYGIQISVTNSTPVSATAAAAAAAAAAARVPTDDDVEAAGLRGSVGI